MKIFLSNAIFVNRAPFDNLCLYFEENEIALLMAINGKGKTTILSHIVDAFHEMARPFFNMEYEGKSNKFYRLLSETDSLDSTKPSVSYLRFKTSTNEFYDYIIARGDLTEAAYDSFVLIQEKIPFSEIKNALEEHKTVKKVSFSFGQKQANLIFESNILTYFPAYRYETPGFLNDPYKIELSFAVKTEFNGKLNNPIEVITGLPRLANWIMDVVLDISNNKDDESLATFRNLNELITKTVSLKNLGQLRFGIAPRSLRGTRIQILQSEPLKNVYPSIFNLSSGESSVLCLFGELIRQADNNNSRTVLSEISGIVLIDEVDKHLHIKLQKEILPALFSLFPNIQFIVSSHSPFLSMGLAEVAQERTKIVDLETFGISRDPTVNELYTNVYQMMIGENDRFKDLFTSLESKVKNGVVPLIITEGKTDIQHLRFAKTKLNIQECNVEFFDVEGDWGDSKLKTLLEQLSKVPQQRRIIGIFDRDVPKIVDDIEKDGSLYKDFGNNVFAFCLPVPAGREQYKNISIEFFYSDEDLKTKRNNKRLYFNNEIGLVQNQADKSIKIPIELAPPLICEDTKKIFDENIGVTNWIHSKAVFADLVENDNEFSKDFDLANFNLIFATIKQILLMATES